MGIFSDSDVNQAEKLIIEYLKERGIEKKRSKDITIDFLDGFQKGLEITKRVAQTRERFPITIDYAVRILKGGDILKYHKASGLAFGYVVAILKYYPLEAIRDMAVSMKFGVIVSNLKTNKLFYNFLKSIILEAFKDTAPVWWEMDRESIREHEHHLENILREI